MGEAPYDAYHPDEDQKKIDALQNRVAELESERDGTRVVADGLKDISEERGRRIDELEASLAGALLHYEKRIDAAQVQLSCMERERDEARAEVADWRDTQRTIMEEKCAPDEKHCTCVPVLRKRVKDLEGALNKIDALTRQPGSPPPLPLEHACVFQVHKLKERAEGAYEEFNQSEREVTTQRERAEKAERWKCTNASMVHMLDKPEEERCPAAALMNEYARERDEARAQCDSMRQMHARIVAHPPEDVERAYSVILQTAPRNETGKRIVQAVDSLRWDASQRKAELDAARTEVAKWRDLYHAVQKEVSETHEVLGKLNHAVRLPERVRAVLSERSDARTALQAIIDAIDALPPGGWGANPIVPRLRRMAADVIGGEKKP